MNIQLILSIIALFLTIGAAINSESLRIALPLLVVAGILLLIPFFLKENKKQKNRQLITISIFLLVAAINLIIIRADVFFNYDPASIKLTQFKDEIATLVPKQGIKIITFLEKQKRAAAFRKTFKEISKKIEYENYDPVIFPDKARKYGITQYGTGVVVYKNRQIKLERLKLRTILAAINLVLEKYKETNICFLTGQKLIDPYQNGLEGGSGLAKLLDENGVKWSSVNLVRITQEKLQGCSVLILAIGENDLVEEEIKTIQSFILGRQKGLFLMIDDDALMEKEDALWLEDMLPAKISQIKIRRSSEAAVTFGKGVVLSDQMGSFAQKVLEPLLLEEPIIIEKNTKPGWQSKTLASVAGESRELIEINKGKLELSDPYSAISQLIMSANGERAVLIGDVQWATNRYINRAGNANFFLNGVLWLLHELQGDDKAAFISYVPPASEMINISDEGLIWFKRIFVFILPSFLFVILFVVWRKL